MRDLLFAAALGLAVCPATAQQPAAPRTVPEVTEYRATSMHHDLLVFFRDLGELSHGSRLAYTSLAETREGRELPLVLAADPPCATPEDVLASGKLRVLVVANIHAGEVEGKEAVQELLREIALGEHGGLLEHAVLFFVPNFNPDGNDRIDAGNRRSQNGPVDGVGERANAAGLDLNRDFVKAESEEVRGLLAAFNRYDPHLFMDLHTTNGSHHGYHLTYAPSLSTNLDPEIDRFGRELLVEVRGAMAERHDFRVFDYGNFPRSGSRSWSTYDHRPRFGTNYYGLRNRIAVLSEAYSYLDFERRIAVTKAFVLEVARAAVRNRDELLGVCARADARVQSGDPIAFGWDTELAEPVDEEVLVGSVRRDGARVIAEEAFEAETMPVRRAFHSKRTEELPAGWALVGAPDEAIATLQRHGLALQRTTRRGRLPDRGVRAECAEVGGAAVPRVISC